MSADNAHDKIYNLDDPVEWEDDEADQEVVRAHDDRLAEIKALAGSGMLEAPAGAEEIVEALADEVANREGLYAQLQRSAADLKNFQRRAVNNEREAADFARRGVVERILPILDNFELALGQDPEQATPEQILGGVGMIREELLRILAGFGVQPIDPEPGDLFDPNEHAAMLQQPAEGIEPGCITLNLGVGYKLGKRVVRPAKVAVAPSETDHCDSCECDTDPDSTEDQGEG